MPNSSVSVTQKRSLLSLAREGDANAISAILSSYCKYKGTNITNIQVRWRDGNLFILCEANTAIQPQNITQSFEQILYQLDIDSGYQVTLYGRIVGQTKPLWSVPLSIKSKAPSADLDQWLNQGKQKSSTQLAVLGNVEPSQTKPPQQKKSRFLRLKWGSNANMLPASTNVLSTATDTTVSRGERSLLLPLAQVQEVLNVPKTSVLPVPYMASCVLGIYHYRGNMLWLVDLAQQLGDRSFLSNNIHHSTLSILVVRRDDGELMGLAVSQVVDIEDYAMEELEYPNTSLFPESFSPFIEYYLPQSLSPILNIQALIRDSKLQYRQFQ